ncbi:MAG: hypothetical protein EP321_02040 [Sphingomonadales bacterium]|nr:MAG: hypothetical protein EP321_02040 [Sphingomonadales bacterium]
MSDRHPLASESDPDALRGTVHAVHNLRFRQALTLDRAWSILLQCEDSPDIMPDDARESTREVLREFGYREYEVKPVDGGDAANVWIRSDWPTERIDLVPLY